MLRRLSKWRHVASHVQTCFLHKAISTRSYYNFPSYGSIVALQTMRRRFQWPSRPHANKILSIHILTLSHASLKLLQTKIRPTRIWHSHWATDLAACWTSCLHNLVSLDLFICLTKLRTTTSPSQSLPSAHARAWHKFVTAQASQLFTMIAGVGVISKLMQSSLQRLFPLLVQLQSILINPSNPSGATVCPSIMHTSTWPTHCIPADIGQNTTLPTNDSHLQLFFKFWPQIVSSCAPEAHASITNNFCNAALNLHCNILRCCQLYLNRA